MKKTHHFLLLSLPVAVAILLIVRFFSNGMPGKFFWSSMITITGAALFLLVIEMYLLAAKLRTGSQPAAHRKS